MFNGRYICAAGRGRQADYIVVDKKSGGAIRGNDGPPREFDVNDALDRAMEVFWRHGYEGASVAELCQAMGIKPPSLYAAFENKAGLFRHVIDRYLEQKTR